MRNEEWKAKYEALKELFKARETKHKKQMTVLRKKKTKLVKQVKVLQGKIDSMQVFIEDLKTQNILEHNELKEISKFTDANSQLVQKLLRKDIRTKKYD